MSRKNGSKLVQVCEYEHDFTLVFEERKSKNNGEGKSTLDPWHRHGPVFVRSALHVMARAQERGFDTTPEYMEIGGHGLSDPNEYLDALEGETKTRIDEPLVVVMAESPPKAFGEFARADVEQARKHLENEPREGRK